MHANIFRAAITAVQLFSEENKKPSDNNIIIKYCFCDIIMMSSSISSTITLVVSLFKEQHKCTTFPLFPQMLQTFSVSCLNDDSTHHKAPPSELCLICFAPHIIKLASRFTVLASLGLLGFSNLSVGTLRLYIEPYIRNGYGVTTRTLSEDQEPIQHFYI